MPQGATFVTWLLCSFTTSRLAVRRFGAIVPPEKAPHLWQKVLQSHCSTREEEYSLLLFFSGHFGFAFECHCLARCCFGNRFKVNFAHTAALPACVMLSESSSLWGNVNAS